MPTIPSYLSREQLPTSSGVRGGIVQVPVIQEPGAQDPGATALEKSLGALPEALQAAGTLAVRTEELQAHHQRAQDVVDSTKAYEDWLQRYQANQARLQQESDYRTLPDETLKAGRQLLVDVAAERTLSPQARERFEAKAQGAISLAQAQALSIQTKRLGQDALYTAAQQVQSYQERMAAATSDAERTVIQADLEHAVHGLVSTGLVGGAEGAKLVRDTSLTVQKDRAMVANRADPLGAVNELQGIAQALNEGRTPEVKTDAYKGLPATMVPEILDDAQRQLREAAAVRDNHERYITSRVKELQGRNEIQLRADLMQLEPRPANLLAIQEHVKKINAAGPAGQVSKEGYDQLTTLGQAWIEKARRPPEQFDDPSVESMLSIKLALASKPADFTELRTDLARNATRLTSETVRSLGTQIETRESGAFYGNRAAYRHGRQMIIDAAVPGATILFPQFLQEEERRQLKNALEAYDASWAGVEPRMGDVQAPVFARQAIDTFLSKAFTSDTQLALPLRRGGPDGEVVQNRQQAIEVLRKLPIDEAQRGRLLREYDNWVREQTRTGAKTAPAGAPTPSAPAGSTGSGPKPVR